MKEATIKFYMNGTALSVVWRYTQDKTDEEIQADAKQKAQNIADMYDSVKKFEIISIK